LSFKRQINGGRIASFIANYDDSAYISIIICCNDMKLFADLLRQTKNHKHGLILLKSFEDSFYSSLNPPKLDPKMTQIKTYSRLLSSLITRAKSYEVKIQALEYLDNLITLFQGLVSKSLKSEIKELRKEIFDNIFKEFKALDQNILNSQKAV